MLESKQSFGFGKEFQTFKKAVSKLDSSSNMQLIMLNPFITYKPNIFLGDAMINKSQGYFKLETVCRALTPTTVVQ